MAKAAALHVHAVLDPLSDMARWAAPLLVALRAQLKLSLTVDTPPPTPSCTLQPSMHPTLHPAPLTPPCTSVRPQVVLAPQPELRRLPLTRLYRLAVQLEPLRPTPPAASFEQLSVAQTLTLHMAPPEGWLLRLRAVSDGIPNPYLTLILSLSLSLKVPSLSLSLTLTR